ncbi:glycosyltransferase family 10 domain-containing protein [Crocosphaera sp. XPORK-15E]|uniref:glycosyltransferase family 10 domain-containing protein n=1 Tax=Crocosphaera sp. XPORK-15E TaxID=3110247 RepID=UPI002B1EC6EC|nr:glycosyltransferase family 10 [Crocosphaera sp. XPORK-15E]MEA5534818.1 glycosyltransferase family 10 [Crocosphaera sp. XPORK-15E]
MNPKIVGMLSSYPGLQDRQDWLWKQTPHHFGVWNNIQMLANDPNPDYLLLYQFDFPMASPPKPWWKSWRKKYNSSSLDIPSLLRNVPQERIIYLLREPPLEEVVKRNCANYNDASRYCGYVSGPDKFAPHPDYMPAIWYVSNEFEELNQGKIPKKVKQCCWITSGIDRTENHRRRLAFLKLLRDNECEFDLYGKRLPSWTESKGSLDNKWHGMAPYYYNLSIENYADNEWYVSEKLWDALLCWCLPIYYGGSAADRLLPPGSFLRLPSLDEKGMAYIKEVTANLDAWHEAKEAIAEARQIILHKLNLMAWLSDFVGQSL